MKFQVTKKDIKNGQRDCPANCPIARSIRGGLREAGAEFYSISVGYISIAISYVNSKNRNRVFRIRASEKNRLGHVRKFIGNFDDGKPVKPITFLIPGLTVRNGKIVDRRKKA